ncbi:transglutaminase-like putative cysteine protease [Lederbergia galactosidilyticus]|uniref:transglutaminase-like domain-containing protein n=1 Tax=Lederbergia galactosidilytica TaxID=217031 RepID=UPI001AE7469B|nr:transglutaminase family protein [Lederbergia galactosidilytica]MBP1916775.1 transglutaminase-like putative cysteine protease [Lederbergia galactosidilytica]
MKLICQSEQLDDYLLETAGVDFSHQLIRTKVNELFHLSQTDIEKAKTAFEFVRDEISHSWDVQGEKVTCKASEVLAEKEGICYAKSHLLAALLRSQGIPAGFCYQRLTLLDTPENGFCLHALNAIYLRSLKKWVRLDARGNKKGVDAQFSITGEKVAFPIRKELGERDYPFIYATPHPKTIAVLKKCTNPIEICKYHLPERL